MSRQSDESASHGAAPIGLVTQFLREVSEADDPARSLALAEEILRLEPDNALILEYRHALSTMKADQDAEAKAATSDEDSGDDEEEEAEDSGAEEKHGSDSEDEDDQGVGEGKGSEGDMDDKSPEPHPAEGPRSLSSPRGAGSKAGEDGDEPHDPEAVRHHEDRLRAMFDQVRREKGMEELGSRFQATSLDDHAEPKSGHDADYLPEKSSAK